jgi:hypothetical protein
VVNVTGTVTARDVGGWEIVTNADGIMRASTLALPSPTPVAAPSIEGPVGPSPSPSAEGADTSAVAGGSDDGGRDLGRLLLALVVGTGAAGSVALGGVLVLRSSGRRDGGSGHGRGTGGGQGTHEHA